MNWNIGQKSLLFLLILVLTAGALQPTAVLAQVDYESYNGLSVDVTPVLPEQEEHPKLWFDQAQIQSLYDKRLADDYAASLWASISSSKYLMVDLPQNPGCVFSNIVHSYYGDMARIAKYNAFLFVMEGGDMHKEKAVEALKRAYDGPIYDCDLIDPTVSSSPIDETYRANWAQNFAAAYDWMQPYLTAEEDRDIRDRLAYEAQVLYENIWIRPDRGWGPRPHNHRSKPAWGLGSLALALSDYDHPDMASPEEWLREALEAANSNLKYFFSSDGVYREGSQYYIYSHINFLPFLYHYKNVSGVDHFRDYKPAFLWEFHVSNNKGWMPNFADSFLRHNYLHMAAPQFMTEEDATELHPTAKWGNLFQWRYLTTDTEPWGGEFGNNTGASYDDTMDLDKYLTYDPTIEAIEPVGSGTHFLNEGGQTVFRNNWKLDDPGSRYLLFHGVAEADNHNQFDQLSFLLHAENQMMASDSGYSQSAYGDAVRRSWYRTAPAHNTVTMDGYWPVDYKQNQTPESKYSVDTGFFDFQQKSARFIEISNDTSRGENPLLFPPDSESVGYVTRAIAFPGQQYFVVADQVESKDGSERDMSFYLHGGKGRMSGEDNFRQWTYGADRYGSAAKFAAWFLTDEAKFTDHEGEISYVKDDYSAHGYVEAAVRGSEANVLQILVPLQLTKANPVVTNLSDSGRAGGTVAMEGYLDTYLVQQNRQAAQVGNLQTDGTFAYVRDHGRVQQLFAREATAIRYHGIELLRSTAPATVALDVSDRSLHSGVLFSEEALELSVRIPGGKQPLSASLNGTEVAIREEADYVILEGIAEGEAAIEIRYEDREPVDNIPPAPVADLNVTSVTSSSAQLAWTAPGGDGNSGTAAYYDIRYSTVPVTAENWEQAEQVIGEPQPEEAGTQQSMAVEGLRSNTAYYFAMKAVDGSDNRSELSNTASGTTGYAEDVTPPAEITDLRVASVSADSVTLHWTAPGNDGYDGTADVYELRYSTKPIDEANWHEAAPFSNPPEPDAAGSEQQMTAEGLRPGRTYFIAAKTSDESGNVSGLSNVVFAQMGDDSETRQLTVASVRASGHDGNVPENVLDGDFTTRWSAESRGEPRQPQWLELDLGAIVQLSHLKMAYHSGNVRQSFFDLQVSVDGSSWTDVLAGGTTSGRTNEFETYELENAAARYVRVVGYGNSSSGWNSISEIKLYGTDAQLPDIQVGRISLGNGEGGEWTGDAGETFLTVGIPLTNNKEEKQKVTVILALYDGNDRLRKVATAVSELKPWDSEVVEAGMNLEGTSNGRYIRIFFWDELRGMQPKAADLHIPLGGSDDE